MQDFEENNICFGIVTPCIPHQRNMGYGILDNIQGSGLLITWVKHCGLLGQAFWTSGLGSNIGGSTLCPGYYSWYKSETHAVSSWDETRPMVLANTIWKDSPEFGLGFARTQWP